MSDTPSLQFDRIDAKRARKLLQAWGWRPFPPSRVKGSYVFARRLWSIRATHELDASCQEISLGCGVTRIGAWRSAVAVTWELLTLAQKKRFLRECSERHYSCCEIAMLKP